MTKAPKLNIDNRESIRKAIKEMKPGDQIEVIGKVNTIWVGVPSLESESETESSSLKPSLPVENHESWLD